VYGICDTKDDEGAFSGEWQTRLRGIEAGTGRFLDFADSDTLLADDRANEDMWDEKAERVRLGLWGRSRFERFLVKSANDETESLLVSAMFHVVIERRSFTFATASTRPLTVRMRSTAPLEYSLTVHFAPAMRRICDTFSPPFPMTVAASALEMIART